MHAALYKYMYHSNVTLPLQSSVYITYVCLIELLYTHVHVVHVQCTCIHVHPHTCTPTAHMCTHRVHAHTHTHAPHACTHMHTCTPPQRTTLCTTLSSSPELFGDRLSLKRVHVEAVGLCRQDDESHHSDVTVRRLQVVVQPCQGFQEQVDSLVGELISVLCKHEYMYVHVMGRPYIKACSHVLTSKHAAMSLH